LEKQKDSSKWHNLVEGNLILKQGLVDKRKVRPQLHALLLLYDPFLWSVRIDYSFQWTWK
jgi:hypothetical protein